MKKILILLFLLLSCCHLSAQESSAAFTVLRLPTSAHVAALGGDNVATLDDDPAMALHNPALINVVRPGTLGLSFASLPNGAQWLGAQYVHELGQRHTAAAFAQYMGYGSLPYTDEWGNASGTFVPKDIVLGGAYSYLLTQDWAGGATLKTLYSSYGAYSAAAIAVDLGLNYYDEGKLTSFSIVARNVGAQIKAYDRRTETLPFSLQVGFSRRLEHNPLRLHFTLIDLTRWDKAQYYNPTAKTLGFGRIVLNHLVVGADLVLSPSFFLSAGYHFRRAYEMQTVGGSHWAGLSAGVGLNLQKLKLNLAWSRQHLAASTLMGALAYTF